MNTYPVRRDRSWKVGILAYGSLIAEPGDEIGPRIMMRIKTETPFPVEYGRLSRTRGEAPTLVPHPQGAPVVGEILVLDDAVSSEEARDMLWRRECRKVGSGEKYLEGSGPNSVLVRSYLEYPRVETVHYTDFHAEGKIAHPSASELANHAVQSVKRAGRGQDGISYLMNAMAAGITTPLTADYVQEILALTQAASLADALTSPHKDAGLVTGFAIDLDQLMEELQDPADDLRRAAIEERLNTLKQRVQSEAKGVTDAELIKGIEDYFDLDSGPEWLNEASWPMDALSFTHQPIQLPDVPIAWAAFQKESGFELGIDDYPLLDGIYYWYFEHRDDPRYREVEMIARSAAVLEYLFGRVRGREASEEYSDILAGHSTSILCLYWGLKDYERVRFYANLLELEFRAGRLGEEKYFESIQFREQALTKRREASGQSIDTDLLHINASLMLMLWHTWSDRESAIDKLNKTNAKLYEDVALHNDGTYPKPARRELSKSFASDWDRLTEATRNHLERGLTFLQDDYAAHSPTAAPEALFMAIKNEVLTRLFAPLGDLDEEILRRSNTTNPLKLLIAYGKGEIRDKRDRETVRKALVRAGCPPGLMNRTVVSGLGRLAEDRDRIAHQESRQYKPYIMDDLHRCRAEVWAKGWFVPFLRGLLGPRHAMHVHHNEPR